MRQERVWAEIDLGAIQHNLVQIRQLTGPDVATMVVLKADGYGHGAAPVARAAIAAGARMIGVGDSTEALELREAGIEIPILILGAIVDGEIEAVVRHRIGTAIHSRDRLALLAEEARRQRQRVPAHLMIDTGMGRLGVSPEMATDLLAAIVDEPRVSLGGVSTHFSTPADAEFSRQQLATFHRALDGARALGLPLGLRHAAASAALLRYPEAHLDMVRPGLLLYGADPEGVGLRDRGFRPALSVRTQVIYLKDTDAGTPIGYQGTHRTQRPTRIATLPVGYDDGLGLALSNRARVLIGGRPAPIVGNVSMDYCMVDVGHLPGVHVGQQVTLIGQDGDREIALEALASQAGTIPYAITCGLGRRVHRLYQGAADGAPRAIPREHVGIWERLQGRGAS